MQQEHSLALLEMASKFAARKHDVRQYLWDVLVKNVGKDTHIVGCDGHRLVKITIDDFIAVLPERICIQSVKNAVKINDSIVLAAASPDRAAKAYPDYDKLIPEISKRTIIEATMPDVNPIYLAESMAALAKVFKKFSNLYGTEKRVSFLGLNEERGLHLCANINKDIKIEIIIMPMRK